MSPDIDFRTIRPWKGSQDSGFEELCCQLYSLESPEAESAFFRKEGAGGDAGVECLWTLRSGEVHGLQSKYFLDELGPTQWSQIDHSVRTALEKYPTLSRYTVCLPRDLADRRVEGEVSQRDHWETRVKKWKGWVEAKGMAVDFVYWGSSELSERLTRDDTRYSGRTLYWFDARLLTPEWFKRKFEMSRVNLGKRYTPEANVDLPIRQVFDGLCRTPALTEELRRVRAQVRREEDRLASALATLERDPLFGLDLAPLRSALERFDSLLGAPLPEMSEEIPMSRMVTEAMAAVDQLGPLDRYLDDWTPSPPVQPASESGGPRNDTRYWTRRLSRELTAALAFLNSRKLDAANSRALLIDGEAGMGKSHLLADIADSHLERGWPTVLLLGQHIAAGNPWDTFLSELDLRAHSVEQVLGALDAAGQAARVRTLILVDAINEGGGRLVWKDRVAGFLASVEPFPHVAVALTCRTTYVRSIIPDDSPIGSLTRVTHHGFQGHESKAAAIYLDRYGIARPNTPLLSPEFSNPLFLKTCCQALNRQGKTSFPRGLRGVKSIFDLYLNSLDVVLEDRIDADPRERFGAKALRELAQRMAAEGRGVLDRGVAKQLLEEVHPSREFSRSLLHHLIAEGALAEDLEYSGEPEDEPRDIVRFTFERFSDHFIAERLLSEHVVGDVDSAFAPGAPLVTLLRERGNWWLRGVVEALAVQVPERFGRELIALVQKSPLPFNLGEGFLKSIIWREPTACSDETREWLVKVGGHNRGEQLWDTVLHVAAEPDHPFNADRLHRNLLGMELPIRDESWSIYLAQNYSEGGDGDPESISYTLVWWAWDSNISGAEDETARLCGKVLTWFFTTSNRVLRDHATKALVSLLTARPHLIPALLEAFRSINDPYVAERLYAAVYGAVLQGVPSSALGSIALEVYRKVFQDGSPPAHVLLRDYARGTIEYARHRGCLPPEVELERVRPPYSSDEWPLVFPTEEEVERSGYDAIRSSVLSMGDFGRYVMGDSSKWSVTPLTQERAETHRNRVEAFRTRTAEDPNPAVAEAFEQLAQSATPPPGEDPGATAILHLFRRMRGEEEVEKLPGRDRLEERTRTIDEAEAAFLSLLPEADREYFTQEIKPYLDWGPMGHRADAPVRFDILAERRWVWRRAHSLGWSPERFESFERILSGGRGERRVERIGKKYQWIAWHELQARLSDHLYLIEDAWSETQGSIFEGPWQLGARDIDPSLLMHSGDRDVRESFPSWVWWRPAWVEYSDEPTEERVAHLWSDGGFPDLTSLLLVRDPDGKAWLVLDGMSTWRDSDDDRDPRPRRDTWIRLQSFLVSRADLAAVLKALADTSLTDPFALRNRLELEAFLGEHPWHPICPPELDDWRPAEEPTPFQPIPVRYLIPVVEYTCEPGLDQSIDDRIDLRLPSRLLREHLGLRWEGGWGANFRVDDDSLVSFDPTTASDGPPATLVAWERFRRMLDSLDLAVVWRIGGEKGLYGRGMSAEFFGRQVLSAVFYTEGEQILGSEWRIEERPSGS